MQEDLTAFVKNHESFAMIVDLGSMNYMPAEQRIKQAKWASSMDATFIKQKVRIAFCIPSIIAKAMLQGVLILSKPGVPHTVVSKQEDAIQWAHKQLNIPA